MNHEDHVNLIRGGVPGPGGIWADFGAGAGAFTLALAELIGPTGTIWAIDADRGALRRLAGALGARFPAVAVRTVAADFTRPLDLPPLDGAIMANALHFVREKEAPLRAIRGHLRPGGRLILVEYNVDRGNVWVPHPFSYGVWADLAGRNGFVGTRLLARRPSRFLGEIYAAVSERPAGAREGGEARGA